MPLSTLKKISCVSLKQMPKLGCHGFAPSRPVPTLKSLQENLINLICISLLDTLSELTTPVLYI